MNKGDYFFDGKDVLLTYPQTDLDPQGFIDKARASFNDLAYIRVAREKHQDGSPHIHAFLQFRQRKRIRHANTVFDIFDTGHIDIQPVKFDNGVAEYLAKDGEFVEWGTRRVRAGGKNSGTAAIFKALRQGSKLSDIIEEEPELFTDYKKILTNWQLYQVDSQVALTTTDVRGIWIYGQPGVGKDHAVLHAFEQRDIYQKLQNKWWDGYTGQTVAWLSDFDSSALGHLLKRWADKWPATGETKGGHVPLNHRLFIITSNYGPDDLFPPIKVTTDREGLQHVDDTGTALAEAIRRRFHVIHMTKDDRDSIQKLLRDQYDSIQYIK